MIASVSCGMFLRLHMAQYALSCSPRHARRLLSISTKASKGA